MAVPTRIIVLPWVIAASRSSDIPIDRVSKNWYLGSVDRVAWMRLKQSWTWAKDLRCLSKSGLGAGIAIKPLRTIFGNLVMASQSASASERDTPLLLSSSLTLTWTHSCNSARLGNSPRWAERRSAILRRSTLWTQSKCSATSRVLLLWSGPIKCHTSQGRNLASRVIFSTASWT